MYFSITCLDRGYDVRDDDEPVKIPAQVKRVAYSVFDPEDLVFRDQKATGTRDELDAVLRSAGYRIEWDLSDRFFGSSGEARADETSAEWKVDAARRIWRRIDGNWERQHLAILREQIKLANTLPRAYPDWPQELIYFYLFDELEAAE